MNRYSLVVTVVLAAACGSTTSSITSPDNTSPSTPAADGNMPAYIPAEPQREGDPARGRHALLHAPYVPCGIPRSLFTRMGSTSENEKIPGRTGPNADLPFRYTAFTAPSGVELVTANCLTCHAGRIRGELVIGLGAADADFTFDTAKMAAAGAMLLQGAERTEFEKWLERMQTIAPYSKLDTVGPNPADTFTAALFAHHDAKTLAWSSEPLIELPPAEAVPADVPPWWHMKKKNAMFFTGAGRGDHARIMMTASVLCTSSVGESQEIDTYFPDIRAYIASIEPPPYPFGIDAALAEVGRGTFEKTCAECHGTYGPAGRYPNRLVPLAQVGTDGTLATGLTQFNAAYVDWFGSSFFGEKARLQPSQAYVAPPLDGIWASAPYLHNASIPTVEAVLDSSRRPKYWTRTFDSNDYDPVALGWRFEPLDHGKDGEPNAKARTKIYDTTRPGYGNGGHLFGDALSQEQRRAVIEYLKTL